MHLRSRSIATSLTVAGLSLAGACGVPRAKPIEGNIRAHIEVGVAEGEGRFDHATWDGLLERYLQEDGRRFDYVGLASEERSFDEYLDALASVELSRLSAPELEALFINAYNAYTVRTVLDHVSQGGVYDIASIRDIDNVFGLERHRIGGFRLSLDNIEHNILRPIFRDPRVHFAVNCASVSCPPLPPRAFSGQFVDEQLERATRSALQNPDYATVEDDVLVLTKILEWYGGDFVDPDYRGAEDSLGDFVQKYATTDVAQWIDTQSGEVPIRFRDYDWSLNKPVDSSADD